LSFLSVAALLFVQRNFWREKIDPLDRLLRSSRPPLVRGLRYCGRSIWRATVLSAVIWLVVLPLVMARFHLVSPSAVLLGPLLAIPVTVAMSAGFVVLLLGWLIPPLGGVAGWLCDQSLASLSLAVDAIRNLPGSHYWVSGPNDWWLAVFYLALAALAVCPHWRPRHRWSAGWCGAWISVGLLAPIATQGERALECSFLSVGHGCAVVVHTPGGKTLLYDAGRLGSPVQPSRAISGYLWSRGITHLDAVIISHADADHYNALPEVLERISVGAVYVSPLMFDEPRGAVAALQRAIEQHSVPVQTIYAGDRLRTDDDCQITVLHPPRKGVLGTDNANSIVLRIEHAGRRVLLTGDLESPGLQAVLAEEPLDCDVLLAPHHGSRFSDPPGLADWATPEFLVISGGARDRAEDVFAAYESRGTRLLHTHQAGAIEFSLTADRINSIRFRAENVAPAGE
jgi:competence protein ComEC